MIVYGTNAKETAHSTSSTATCQHCNTKGSLRFSVFYQYAHIFWIPFFPYKSIGYAECTHCNEVTDKSNMNDELKREYDLLKAENKPPIWMFSGLGVAALIALLITYSVRSGNKQDVEFMNSPKVGDVYEYKTEDGNFSTMKVVAVMKDSVGFLPNNYEVDKMKGLHSLKHDSCYANLLITVHKDVLLKELEDDIIIDVERK